MRPTRCHCVAASIRLTLPADLLAGNFDARHLVAQFERQLERDFGRLVAGAELERRFAEPLAARRVGIDDAFARRSAGREHEGLELALVAEPRNEAERLVAVGFIEHRECAVARERGKLLADVGGIRLVVDAVVQPDDARVLAARLGECRLERGDCGSRDQARTAAEKRCGAASRFARRLDFDGRQFARSRRPDKNDGPAARLRLRR